MKISSRIGLLLMLAHIMLLMMLVVVGSIVVAEITCIEVLQLLVVTICVQRF